MSGRADCRSNSCLDCSFICQACIETYMLADKIASARAHAWILHHKLSSRAGNAAAGPACGNVARDCAGCGCTPVESFAPRNLQLHLQCRLLIESMCFPAWSFRCTVEMPLCPNAMSCAFKSYMSVAGNYVEMRWLPKSIFAKLTPTFRSLPPPLLTQT
jgi:hypothetical protein